MSMPTINKETRRRTRADALVSPDWLENHLDDPHLRVIEVDVSPAAYSEGHIEGALLWNVYSDLKDAEYRPVDDAAIAALLSRSGIGADSTVVFYGYAPALAYWLLTYHRHADARILDSSREAWRSAGRAWTTDPPQVVKTEYELAEPDASVRARMVDVMAAIDDPGTTIVDMRTRSEYDGERFWPSGGMEPGGRAGHIPTAVNIELEGLYEPDGGFRGDDRLAAAFGRLDPSGDRALITYCTVGGRAATAWFVLTVLLGRDGVRVYDGSWAEWGRTASMPVAQGAESFGAPSRI